VAASFGTIVGVAGRIGSGTFQLATVVVLSIYFSLSLERMRRRAVLVFTADRREQGERLLNRAVDKIGGDWHVRSGATRHSPTSWSARLPS
jgi:predicted PurR-regulated permease PerM